LHLPRHYPGLTRLMTRHLADIEEILEEEEP